MNDGKSTRVWLQIVASVAATLGGLTLGLVIGWASPAQKLVINQLGITNAKFSWIAGIMPIGAAASTIFMALCFDIIGRKWLMIAIAPLFSFSWIVLAFSDNLMIYCVGRFLTGFFGGAFCVAAPNYTAELSQASIRGLLGAMFQLMICTGIMISYALGETGDLKALGLPAALPPLILVLLIFFMHDSPVFLLKKGREDKARKAMRFFRGKNYDIEPEMKDMAQYVKVDEQSAWQVFKQKHSIKAFMMLLVLHVGQQLSGINAVMFFAAEIFHQAGSTLSPGISSIILGVVQIIATAVCTLVVDKLGRRLLLIFSIIIMIICLILLAIFFIIKEKDLETAKSIGILPLLSLCVYLIGFSFGAGPLPWMMLGELLPNQIKSYVASFITCVNWLMAFVVTVSFLPIVEAVGAPSVYFGFAVLQALTLAFVVLVLIETKNKTLEQIQLELAGTS